MSKCPNHALIRTPGFHPASGSGRRARRRICGVRPAKGRLADANDSAYRSSMIPTEISNSALSLAESDRLELARALVESVAVEREVSRSINEGVRRIDEIASGRIVGLTEEQYRAAVR